MIKYHVNSSAKCVVAYFEGGKSYWKKCLIDMLCNITSTDDHYWESSSIIDPILASHQSLGGIARCHPDDVFDEKRGKILAKARLLTRWENVKTQVIKKYKQDLDSRVAMIEYRINKRLVK